ncbi:hypothetical protein ACFL6U_25415 [Planctomycetota bacterium]
MIPQQTFGRPHLGPGYVPYFYSAGRFLSYNVPQFGTSLTALSAPSVSYDFTSDLVPRHTYSIPQSVDQVIRKGYLFIPKSEPETALISDKKHTARLGLDDVIGQIRNRHQLFEKNMYDLEWAKCSVINSLYQHQAYHGVPDGKVEYSVNKRLDELYSDQREERTNLWRDVSRLRLQLPENAQQYLSAYRKVAILEDTKGDAQ